MRKPLLFIALGAVNFQIIVLTWIVKTRRKIRAKDVKKELTSPPNIIEENPIATP